MNKAPSAKAAPAPTPSAAAPAAKAPAKAATRAAKAAPAVIPSGPLTGADAWSKAELEDIRVELDEQAAELRREIENAEAASESLKRDQSSEGSGDEADAGTKTFEREHEMSLANNSRDLLVQVERALGRLDAGTYGRCENCGNPIPKARLQAFPRATLCVTCKQREERR
ncbi:MAG: TraR/DksA C4-type zinc finger protein [Actinobacteria bacterium]|nr:TraR/DksA C4-type zinc finger protein [Actinomycetota bacterium]MBW3647260.1 TraR/DksA C4-type zinc finger protein [Actinomycetota bacterium]